MHDCFLNALVRLARLKNEPVDMLAVQEAVSCITPKQMQAPNKQIESEKARVTRKLKSDFILLKAAENRHEALQLAKQNALSGFESSTRQFKAGRKSWQELLNSARELAQADAQWVDAYGQYLVAAWQMLLDTQGLRFLVGEQSDA